MTVNHAKEWQRKRALLLHVAFQNLETALQAGGTTLEEQVAVTQKSLSGVILMVRGKGRYMACSRGTLMRALASWREGGRTPDALLHDYQGGFNAKADPELVREFQRRATLEGVLNMSAAMASLARDWAAGNHIEGLGSRREWNLNNGLPVDALSDFPISRRTLYRWKPSKVERAGGVFGKARLRAAGAFVDMNYSMLRKAELYVLDDVRLDLLVVDERTGRVVEVVCYILMEVASRSIVAFVMKPKNAIRQEDVDELLAYGLQTPGYGLGVGYVTHIKFERGTVACSEAAQLIMEGCSNGRLRIHRTSMDGGVRWVGAPKDKASGHAAGKAVIESFNRRLHLALMLLPGQRGNNFGNQPQNLGFEGADNLTPGSLAAECQRLASFNVATGNRLLLNLRMLYLGQALKAVRQAITEHNNEPGHDYSGHGSFTQAEVLPGVWQEVNS